MKTLGLLIGFAVAVRVAELHSVSPPVGAERVPLRQAGAASAPASVQTGLWDRFEAPVAKSRRYA